jgi:hypothetical protein
MLCYYPIGQDFPKILDRRRLTGIGVSGSLSFKRFKTERQTDQAKRFLWEGAWPSAASRKAVSARLPELRIFREDFL